MKALILAAGEGLRCRPLTLTRSKVMLPVANRPILEYIIRSLEQNDLTEIILVVGYKKERIMDYFGNGKDFGINISYIEQEAQLGTAHAIKLAEPMVNEKFLVLNGDNIIDGQTIRDLIKGASGDVTLLTVTREHTTGYGVILLDKGRVSKIVEKPRDKISRLVNTGIYMFSSSIFDEIDRTPISETGEYAITDTIQRIIDKGANVTNITTKGTWFDAVHSWDLLKANSIMLGKFEGMNTTGSIEKGAVIIGDVDIGDNSVIRSGSYIVGPVIIGKNCNIGPNATILPSTSVGDNCTINSFTEIENSIIMNDVRIGAGSYIQNSIIGSNNIIGPHFISEMGKDLKIEMKGILHTADELGTVIGDNNIIGPSVLVKAGKMIATGCAIDPGVRVTKDIPPNSTVL
ncbi:MAG: sugar phosphate nucleotidyltransferase [Candidatus Methanoperedens sp.]|nr:sugar phosphate nucleotidyltransferase [Candidatus Methanoperedens sp.]CAG1009646.1 glucose-1-phosphate thymidylyltransferase [Methanosarcinales archaeon]